MSYQELIKAAEAFVAGTPDESRSSREIADHLERLMGRNDIERHPRNVILSYLSRAANHDEASRLVSGGPYGGYSVEAVTQAADASEPPFPEPESDVTSAVFQMRERHLYPLIKAWLEASEYISADVSALKAGGQWGNPDLLGVSRIEILGASEIELVSVEAKLSDVSWERFIFEAVSHKRFANRSWFCYRTSTSYSPLPKNMAYYAERYKVGILQIHLTDDEVKRLAEGPSLSAEYLDRVQERVRALYEPVPLQEKKAFLDRAGMGLNLHVVRHL